MGTFSRYEQCIDYIPYYLSGLSRAHFFRQPFSKQLYKFLRAAAAMCAFVSCTVFHRQYHSVLSFLSVEIKQTRGQAGNSTIRTYHNKLFCVKPFKASI